MAAKAATKLKKKTADAPPTAVSGGDAVDKPKKKKLSAIVADTPSTATATSQPTAALTTAPSGAPGIFDRFDVGGKGYLRRDEFERALAAAAAPPVLGPFAPLAAAARDGASGGTHVYFPGTASALYGSQGASAVAPPYLAAGTLNSTGLAQAYQTRLAALSSVAASLLGKREELSHQV